MSTGSGVGRFEQEIAAKSPIAARVIRTRAIARPRSAWSKGLRPQQCTENNGWLRAGAALSCASVGVADWTGERHELNFG